MLGRHAALVAMLACTVAAACGTPHETFDEGALKRGFVRQQVAGAGFDHALYVKGAKAGPLHVYLASDGRPWLRRHVPAGDPTPRALLVLDLMALDPAEAVMLGRPCYHGLQPDPPCTAEMWTSRRYAPEVVASLSTALERLTHRERPLVLIGHSGGGTLAMLLAARHPETLAVVTIAPPLDHAAWTAHHGYLPLDGSLDAAGIVHLPDDVLQLHLVGSRDDVVPPELLGAALLGMRATSPFIIAGADHHRGWNSVWPSILAVLKRRVGSESVPEAEGDDMLFPPGVAGDARILGGEGSPLIERGGQ